MGVGGVSFGFNQTAMDEICVREGGFMRADQSALQKCHEDAESFMVVETKLARFVAMVEILEAKQIAFKASVKNDVQTMKQNIKEHAEGVLEAAEAGQKIHALNDFLMEETQRTTSGIAKLQVNQAVKKLNEAGHELQSALKREMQGLKHLLTECNTGLFTGVGSDKEYLLDMCSQTSGSCLEKTSGRHSGCCCAYSPLTAIGKRSMSLFTIPGISSFTGGRVAGGDRRLADRHKIVDICGESWKLVKDEVAKTSMRVEDIGGANLLKRERENFAAAYPSICKAVSEAASGVPQDFAASPETEVPDESTASPWSSVWVAPLLLAWAGQML